MVTRPVEIIHLDGLLKMLLTKQDSRLLILFRLIQGKSSLHQGATESDNLALKGVFEMYHRKGNHIITLTTEHKAVLDSCKKIEKMGGEVTYLDVNEDGLVNLDELEAAIKDNTILVSIMWANNETGVIQPMKEIGEICARKGVLFMSDATQAVGKIPVDPKTNGIHLMAFTGHKMYGPKGVGALFVNRKSPPSKSDIST